MSGEMDIVPDPQWHSDADFWSEFYTFIFDQSKEENAENEVEQIIKLAGVSSGTLLDIPCGPGRHSVEFAKKGFSVTALDINTELLFLARTRAAENGVDVEFIRRDMRSFGCFEKFDLAVNMYTSLGYFCDSAEDLKVTDNIHASLRYGGMAVFEMAGREIIRNNFVSETVEKATNGVVCRKFLEPDADWRIMRNTWELERPGVHKLRTVFEQLIYSRDELCDLLKQSGFTETSVFGGLEGDKYSPSSRRLVAVSKK